MCTKQYEYYLAECFFEWVSKDIQSGTRYQFKSPNYNKSVELYKSFLELAEEKIINFEGYNYPYIDCNGVFLIPVLQGNNGEYFSENFISYLRDAIANREDSFNNCALLIIHNSMLDTLINSAFDVSLPKAIWNPEVLAKKLLEFFDTSNKKEIVKYLLDDQLTVILEEEATVFGFAALFNSLQEGEIAFDSLGLFNDPLLYEFTGQTAQIRNRINENRKLYNDIKFIVDHYPEQLESKLEKLSSKFIKQHFIDKQDWNKLTFDEYITEQNNNKEQLLTFEDVENSEGIEIFKRTRSSTNLGKREISLLVKANIVGKIKLKFIFNGNDLESNQIHIKHNLEIEKGSISKINRTGGKRCWYEIDLPYHGLPSFFTIEIRRNKSSENYKFRCLLLQKGDFYLDDIKTCFRIDALHKKLVLQLEENNLRIRSKIFEQEEITYILKENDEIISSDHNDIVDFDDFANKSEDINFNVSSGSKKLSFCVEGIAAEDTVIIPLLFDKERFRLLFDDNYNAQYNLSKNKIIIDNSEIKAVGVRQQLLSFEERMVKDKLLFLSSSNQSIINIENNFPAIHQSYDRLFDYLIEKNTLPSLVSWGENYCQIVQDVIDSYENILNEIPEDRVLEKKYEELLKIGIYEGDNRERICPLHPLVLSYNLMLVKQIMKDKSKDDYSFAKLPNITLERLVASGLLPYVFDSDSDYAQVIPVKENCFWLDIIPKKQAVYTFVRKLVLDKIEEFTRAYSRLFSFGRADTLIINAINQKQSKEVFLGLVDYFKRYKDQALSIHVNLYDKQFFYTDFDLFAETISYEELKTRLGLNIGALKSEAEIIIDIIRNRLTYSKFNLSKESVELEYAHLSFFSNNTPVDCRDISIEKSLSGVLCDGLISGEAAEATDDSYFTAFGLRDIEYSNIQSLRLARLIGTLWKPAKQSNSLYIKRGIGLAVNNNFQEFLNLSYDSSIWTTIIDPKVTLDFFTKQKSVILIHYSDQYTTSVGYDAITVTKQIDLFHSLLKKENSEHPDELLAEFNAFNGEWLLKMLTANEKERKEKKGVIGAYKFINAILNQSDICWIPISVAEMIRVSGNIGLKMKESDFSRYGQSYKKGSISDDVLFIGFKDKKLYLLPLEVKAGVRPNFNHAEEQVKELKRYLVKDILGKNNLASRLYRGLFIRQVLMQVEKFKLYNVLCDNNISELLDYREWWLKGTYEVAELFDYFNGIIVAFIENDCCYEPSYKKINDNILQIELPYSLLSFLINKIEPHDVIKKFGVKDEFIPRVANHNNEISQEINEIGDLSINQHVNVYPQKEISLAVEIPKSLNILLGNETITGKPTYWEPTNTALFMNTNTGIIGTMGTGKTQFTKSIITQLIQNQGDNVNNEIPIGILIFDYKADYEDEAFIKETNSKVLSLFNLPYNPLSLIGEVPMLPVHTASSFTETMAKAFNLGNKQQLKLKNLILEAYKIVGIDRSDSTTWSNPAPTISQVWDLFLKQDKVEEDSLYVALDSLISFNVFESTPSKVTSLYDLLNGCVVIKLDGYSPQIQSLVVALTLDLFYSQMQKNGKPLTVGDYRQITKIILVDEADNFMSQDFSSLRKILKEGREYGVGILLSTQDMSHFKTSENNYANYILTWIVHRVATMKNTDIKAIFNKDDKVDQDKLMEEIRKLKKHTSLYVDGDKKIRRIKDKAFWELIDENK